MSRDSFHPGSDRHALLVAAGMFLLLAVASVFGGVSFLAAPAFVFAVLSATHAVFGGTR
jgi:hypothetical protein